jgi:hypothetical protein
MSIEYEDGRFSEIMNLDQALERLGVEAKEGKPIVALHVAPTTEALIARLADKLATHDIVVVGDSIMKEKTIEERVKDLEDKVKEFKVSLEPEPFFVDKPTQNERRALDEMHKKQALCKLMDLKKKGLL